MSAVNMKSSSISAVYAKTSPPERKLLVIAICAICKDAGFEDVSRLALESLAELVATRLGELAAAARQFSELANRSDPDLSDVRHAMIESGVDIFAVSAYARRGGRARLKPPQAARPPVEPKAFRSTGALLKPPPRPSHVPAHLPDFPDAHAFVRTATLRRPDAEFRRVRDKIASEKRENCASFMRYLARTVPAHVPVFEGADEHSFPLVRVAMDERSYLRALLPEQSLSCFEDVDDVVAMDDAVHADAKDAKLAAVDESSVTSPSARERMQENAYLKPPKRMRIK